MADALARARRFRSRAHEFHQLAETCGSARHAKHYYLIAKHFMALAHLEEDRIVAPSKEGSLASSKEGSPPLAPQ